MADPSFLPARASTDGEWFAVCAALYAVYERDLCKRLQHQGVPVLRDTRILPDGDGKEEGFWHLITAEDRSIGDRLFDPERACRLPWVGPLVVSPARSEVVVFDYEEGKRQLRRYIWLKEHDFVVILEHRGKRLFLVTAFHVSFDGKRRQLARRAADAAK